MNALRDLPRSRFAVLIACLGLFLVWLAANFRVLTGSQNGLLRFGLTAVFSALILLRPKPAGEPPQGPRAFVPLALAAGVPAAVGGIVFNVHQFEWLGILLVMAACLRWALPAAYGRDILRALFLLYWAHPLPSQVFGPLQLTMQKLSVRGTEWFLHLWNVRVWADGFVLRTGTNQYEIPEWCSGMRTATAVFLLACGLGILRRLRLHQGLVIVALGLAQALLLNILRLAAMVVFAPRRTEAAGVEFLHDTGGILVLLAVFLVYVELDVLRRLQERRVRRRQELQPGLVPVLSEHPPFWRVLLRQRWRVLAAVLAALLAAGVAFKSRATHRLHMIRDVALALRDAGRLEDAHRAAQIVQPAFADDAEWRLAYVRLLLLRGQYAEVLDALDRLPQGAAPSASQRGILRAYALMGLDRLSEAAAIVKDLPDEIKHSNPRVAVILMEWSFYAGDADGVTEYIVPASRWAPNTERVRALYPYLRSLRRWEAIADSETRLSYRDPVQAFSAAEALMNLNRSARVAELAVEIESRWPGDPRLLELQFFLALKRGPGDWEERFAAHLGRLLRSSTDIELLYKALDKCFDLGRPDLAWAVHRRMRALDPSHPALYMAVVRHGQRWFAVRTRHLGMSAPRVNDTTDLRGHYLIGRTLGRWRRTCAYIPLGEDLCRPDLLAIRKAFLQKALAEFEQRDRQGTLSLDFRYEYVQALEIAEQPELAGRRLEEIGAEHPEREAENRLRLSELYARQGDWQSVYETLRDYLETADPPLPPPVFRLCRAQLNLRLGLAALHTAWEAVRRFPQSGQAAAILAEVLAEFDSHEEALAVLSRPRAWRQRGLDLLEAKALYVTRRYNEAEGYCRSVLLPTMDALAQMPQRLVLPPAELTLLWHRLAIPTGRQFAENARVLQRNLPDTTSPFVRALTGLWLECYDAGCAGPSADPARWTACGRDRIEQAVALNQLMILLCWQDKLAEARQVAEQAVACLPDSPLLWRACISLSGADPEVARLARAACPADSEIWLAELVAHTRPPEATAPTQAPATGADEAWALGSVAQAVKSSNVTPAAMTRAGEYLLRIGMRAAASSAARDAVSRARGLLPAYVLGVRCALSEKDKPWAVLCTKQAIEASVNPPAFFYRKLVALRMSEADAAQRDDLIDALKNLREQEPDHLLWAQILGYVSFERGGVDRVRALHEMTAALAGGATNRVAYLVGAEAARYLGNREKAVELLREGLERYPRDLAMLNNLAFILAAEEPTSVEALELLPALVRQGGRNLDVLDTVATVHLSLGHLDTAEAIAEDIARRAPPDSPGWFRACFIRARVAVKRGQPEKARPILEDALKRAKAISDEDLFAANALLTKISEPSP